MNIWTNRLGIAILLPFGIFPLGRPATVLARPGSGPTIVHPIQLDRNFDGIADSFEDHLANAYDEGGNAGLVDVIVTLYSPPREAQLAAFRRLGGVISARYLHATYGLAGRLPALHLRDLARELGDQLCLIESDGLGHTQVDDSMRQVRVRPLVWSDQAGYGLMGAPDITIAIFDSGIDATHPDIAGRVVFWHDWTWEAEPTAVDRMGHGTAVAGIAAGTGQAIGSGPVTSITTSTYYWLGGFIHSLKVPAVGNGLAQLRLHWQTGGTACINLSTPNEVWLGEHCGSTSPLVADYTIADPGMYRFSTDGNGAADGAPYAVVATYPYVSPGDGFNLFSGIAPHCSIAGVKIVDQTSGGLISQWIAAYDSIAAVNVEHNIKVVNHSGGYTEPNLALETAINGLVSAGTVVACAAGNVYPYGTVLAPAMSAKAIAVGAINDLGALTSYSCMGPVGSEKPDVLAPGGSYSVAGPPVGSGVMTCDTNANECANNSFPDRNPNDYTPDKWGTSYASPHVAGLAALVIQALANTGHVWSYSNEDALLVKNIILMTATETNLPREMSAGGNPTLDRGGRDRMEGYGRINADAAAEAVLTSWSDLVDSTLTLGFGSSPFSRKAWACRLTVDCEGSNADLQVPAGLDLDLYIYAPDYANGDPVILARSTTVGAGLDEFLTLGLSGHSVGFLVAKWVTGSGETELRIHRNPTAVGEDLSVPQPILGQNQPNPFGPETRIRFHVPSAGNVHLQVFTLDGRTVKSVELGHLDPGWHEAKWDGRDAANRSAAAGAYFYRVRSGAWTETRRILLIR